MRQSDREIEAAFPPEGSFIEVDGWRFHALIEGRGPAIVLLHGAGGSTRDMSFRLMPALRERLPDHSLIALDRPGHGYTASRSDELVISPLEQAALIWRVLDTMGHHAPVLLGQSYGGAVTLAMELLRPGAAAGLCLVSAAASNAIPTGAQGAEILTRLEMVRDATLATLRSPRFQELALARLFTPEPVPAGYAAHFGPEMTMRERTFRHHMLQVSSLEQSLGRMMPHYPSIATRVEILHGTGDDILDHDRHGLWLSSQIKGARLTSLPGAGHMPHHTCAEQVCDAVFRLASAG